MSTPASSINPRRQTNRAGPNRVWSQEKHSFEKANLAISTFVVAGQLTPSSGQPGLKEVSR
jgi:hypothetical protein